MDDIDKWCAEQCGVELYSVNFDNVKWSIGDSFKNDKWTITDPRCVSIIEQALLIHYEVYGIGAGNKVIYYYKMKSYTETSDSIDNSKRACIAAIYEARE